MGIEVLLILFILWVIVTLVGHGSWLVLAAIFGKRTPPGQAPLDRRDCPRCNNRLDAATGQCRVCGWPREPGVRADRDEALTALRRHLASLRQLEAVDVESFTAIQETIKAQQVRLAAMKAAPPAEEPAIELTPIELTPIELTPIETAPVATSPGLAPVESPVSRPQPPVPPATPAERVRTYAASRVAAMESSSPASASSPSTPAPPKQRQALSRLFAAFMEEKNIRWGELVGGLLIVGCSIALVISFWSQIAENPMLKFGLLGGVTAALFGVGMYTDRRWKIHNTSHGILVIATLLVPLNFLAIAAFTQGAAANDALTLAGEGISAVVFSVLVYLAAKIIAPVGAVPFAVGVMVPSLVQLAVRRWAEPGAALSTLYALAGVPVACYVGATSLVMRRAAIQPALEPVSANRLFTFLGVVSAATFFPLALLAWQVPPMEETIHRLSPLAVWCGVPALVCGLLFWRRMNARQLTGLQTAGLAVGVLGAAIMAGAAVAAWPDPATLLPVAAMNFVALTVVALWFGIPAAHLPAGLAMAAIWLISIYLRRGDIGWTLESYEPLTRVLVSAMSGRMLVPLAGAMILVAGVLRRGGRREDGLMYAIVAAVTGAASLALVLWFGFSRAGDPENIVWTLGIYAIAALAAGVLIDRPAIVWVGPALLLATLWQGIVYRWTDALGLELPRETVLLVHASLMLLGSVALTWGRRKHANLQTALTAWTAFSSVVAAALLVAALPDAATRTVAIYLAWLSAIWLGLSLVNGWAVVFAASQVATVLAIFAGVTAAVETREWYTAATRPWLDPWFLEAQGVALGLYALVCGVVRWYFARVAGERAENVIETPVPGWFARGVRLLHAPWPGVDQVLLVGLVSLFVAVAIYAVVPGVGQELAPLAVARGAGPAVRVVAPVEQFEIAGVDPTHAAGGAAWLFGVTVAAGLAVAMARKRHVDQWAFALLLVLAMVCPLSAARWGSEIAVASALRWFSAAFFVAASVALWIAARGRERLWGAVRPNWIRNFLIEIVALVYVALGAYVAASALRTAGLANQLEDWLEYVFGWALLAGSAGLVMGLQQDGGGKPWLRTGRNVLLLLAVAPLAVLFAFAVATALDQHPIVGPDPVSWFRRIGWDVSYGVPLALVALGLVGHAIRDRSSGLAFSAGLLANVVATIVVLMRLARGGGGLDATGWIVVAQVNALVTGGVALAWLGAVRWKRAREPMLLVTQVALAAAFCGTFLLPAVVRLVGEPAGREAWLVQAGSLAGWVAALLATIAASWLNWRRTVYGPIVAFFAAALVALCSLASMRWDTGNWLGFHILLAGLVAAAWLLPLVTLAANRLLQSDGDALRPLAWSAISARLFGIAAVGVALRALDGDPAAPWWTIGVLAAISLRNVWIAWHEGGHGSMWIAAVLSNLAVSIWWFDQGSKWSATRGVGGVLEIVWVNAIAAAAMAVVSVLVTSRWATPGWVRLAYHRFAAWAIAVVLLLVTGVSLFADYVNDPISANPAFGWAAWVAAVAAAVACWWDARSRWPVACIYTVGLVAVGMYLDGLNFQTPMFQWALALALAAYSLVTSSLWSRRSEIAAALGRLRVPVGPQREGGHDWLLVANGLTAIVVLALVAWIEVTMPEFRHRMIAAYAIGAEAVAIALLARGAIRSPLQYVSLLFGVLFAIAFAWAWFPPTMPAPWLHRIVAAIVALAATMVVYGLGLVKLLRRENEWTRAAQRLVPVLAVISALLLIGVLAIEVTAFAFEEPVPITWPALLAVAIALVGLAAAALVAALVPGRDPLGLSERGRTAYVYAAEVLLALAFLHIRVTMPWLFSGWFLRFWPLVVMAIAFVGVGLGEFFQRRRQNVLAGPLTTTGALLPLLPALGFWVTSSEIHYSLVLLSVGVLYAAVSALRKSFWFAVLAALAANGSLWYLLHRSSGLSIADHPQLWLIPPALCVLVAGYLNRARLSAEQSVALRYGSAIVIYASSTADIFINGVADAPWLPAVLAALSILGVFAGILLRVRAFLYLGVTFLTVALMTIIWYAAIEQQRTWILWVAGIVTGVLIIVLFGVFEKRRDDVLRVVDRLKQWET